jgi:hypothetical protein
MAGQNLILNILAKDKTKQAFSGIQAGLTRLRSTIFSVQSALLGIGAGVAIKSFVDVGRQVEELGIRFNFLFGSVSEGSKAFNTLVNYAARVPFSLEEISTASGNLAVVSKDAKELENNLKIVGNVAAVTGLDFRTTAEQIQRSFAGGIASADIFRERGVRALLGFKAGVNVTAEETVKRFNEVFGEGGRFGKATEVFATTFTGTLSMLQDKLFKFRLETSRAGFFDFLKGGLIVINKRIEENGEALSKFSEKLGLFFVNAIKNIVKSGVVVIGTLKPIFQFMLAGMKGVLDVIGILPPIVKEFGIIGFFMLGTKGKLLTITIGYIIKKIQELLKYFGVLGDSSGKTADNLSEMDLKLQAIDNTFADVEKEALSVNDAVRDILTEMEKANKEAEAMKDNFTPLRQQIIDLNMNALKKSVDLARQFFEVMDMGIKGTADGIAKAIVLGENLKASFANLANQILIKIIAALVEASLQMALQVALKNSTIAALIQELGLEKLLTAEKKKQREEEEKKNKAQGAALLMSGNPLGFLGFMAKGGSVSKGEPMIVGEQGAELFIPNSSGQITQAARGTGGGAVSVNFNINTLDARGFDELLVRNRGTITQIINNAVNERGSKNLI